MEENNPLNGKHPNYYEGILQLRDYSKKLKDFVNQQIKDNNIYVAKRVKLKNGIDILVSSNKFLIKLAKQLKQDFSGDLKISKKLFSKDRMTQKEIWRITVLFREANIKLGSTIEVRGEKYKINSIGKNIEAKNLNNGKKKLFSFDEIKN